MAWDIQEGIVRGPQAAHLAGGHPIFLNNLLNLRVFYVYVCAEKIHE
jgi:hypothetical protein